MAANAKEKSTVATVVAVSTQSVGDLQAPSQLKVGDEVIFDKFSGSEVTIDGDDYLIVHEKDVIGVF